MISLEILMFLLVVIDGVLIYFYIEKTKDIKIIVEFSIEFISIVLTIITTTDISLFTSIWLHSTQNIKKNTREITKQIILSIF